MRRRSCEVVIFGGGFAGLWILDRLVQAGYDALLLESKALGEGQSIQAQGIIHGGGKYALRGVRDFAAVQAIREMPELWRRSLRGEAGPDLRAARVLSERCHLWVPRAGGLSRLTAWGWMPLVLKAGLLNARPEALPREAWPPALEKAARSVYAMAEPVLSTRSALAAFASLHASRLLHYPGVEGGAGFTIDLKNESELVVNIAHPDMSDGLELRARMAVLAAGEGNELLLRRAAIEEAAMQRRPLRMVVLRGTLPSLYGHCVQGGRTAMTVTTHPLRPDGPVDGTEPLVWQVGGDVAERHGSEGDEGGGVDEERVLKDARRQLFRLLKGVDFGRAEMMTYRAVRAEAESRRHRRPSGVHCNWVAPRTLLTWPTKMALSPVLSDEVLERVQERLGPPGRRPMEPLEWPRPAVAADPWDRKEVRWSSVL